MTNRAGVDLKAGKILIGGEWSDSSSGRCFDTIDPTTGEGLTSVVESDTADVDGRQKLLGRRYATAHGPRCTLPIGDVSSTN